MIIISLGICGFFGGGSFLCELVFSTDSTIFTTISDHNESKNPTIQQVEWLEKESGFTNCYTNSTTDGIDLHALSITNQNTTNDWVIMVHGYRSNPWRVSDYAYNYYNLGYNVLLPALRGSLETGGKWITFGLYEHLDICDWINFLVEHNPSCRIILHGVSMGAATVMLTAGENLPDNVRLVIEDSGYTSLVAQLAYIVNYYAYTPSFPALQSVDLMMQRKAGFAIKEVDCIESLKKATLPIYFIHGKDDIFVPYFMHEQLYSSYSHAKDKLVIEKARHIHGSTVDAERYWSGITNFIATYF